MSITSRNRKGPGGLATVKIDKRKGVATVQYENTHHAYEIMLEDAPDNLLTGKYFVNLDPDAVRIVSVRPPRGAYMAKFTNFAHKKDEPPTFRQVAMRTGQKKDGSTFVIKPHLEFTAVFEVASGDFKGFEIPHSMWYCFEPFETDPNEAQLVGQGRGKVEAFLQAVGYDFLEDSIPYSDNVLPAMEKTILEKDKEVVLSLNQYGYVQDLTEAPK